MLSAEKLQRCLENAPVNDRRDIPVLLQLITYCGVCAGMTQKEIHESNDKFMEAKKFTYDTVGYPDCDYFLNPADTCFGEALPVRRPGIELGDNELFQFVETVNMQPEDYDAIATGGWDMWNAAYMCRIQNPPMTPDQLFARWGLLGAHAGNNIGMMMQMGVQPIFGTVCVPPFDMMSLIRSFGEFIMDLYEEPERVDAATARATDDMIASVLQQMSGNPIKRIGVFAMRSDASVISPSLFDEFSFPYLKKMINAFWEAGFTTILHADGNWVPMLDRFLELPKNSVSFEFDSVTDLREAYNIIGGWHSMRGDLSAVQLTYNTADEVREYCEGLITDLGMKGGFMLGSGCEVPMSAKAENVAAIIKSVRE